MSRRTYSLSAAAVAVAAGLSFSSVDNAVAFAQDVVAQDFIGAAGAQNGQDLTEETPQETVFVSEEIVQPLEQAADPSLDTDEFDASSLGELVGMVTPDEQLTEQMQCLAGAVYFESRGEPLAGQLAVAQVVINRSEDNRWPASYCGVVYQRAQFSFVRGGQMPRINTSSAAWQRAKAIATIAHDGLWESEAADAVYFHATYVRPSWSRSKTRLTQIDTHIFYR